MLKNFRYVGLVCILAFVFAACDQADEANKINVETNALINKYNANNDKKVDLYNKLLGSDLNGVTDIKAYQEKNSAEFDELEKSIEGQLKLSKETVEQYSPIIKLDVPDAYKEYAKANLAVHDKRIEVDQSMLDFVKSFIETDDIDELNKMIEDRNTEMGKLDKEMEDLEAKVAQIEKDNPDDIKDK